MVLIISTQVSDNSFMIFSAAECGLPLRHYINLECESNVKAFRTKFRQFRATLGNLEPCLGNLEKCLDNFVSEERVLNSIWINHCIFYLAISSMSLRYVALRERHAALTIFRMRHELFSRRTLHVHPSRPFSLIKPV